MTMRFESEISADDVLPARLPKGFVLGSYVVDGWIRDGGMAAIHRARRVGDERRVAIKLQLPSPGHDPAAADRFEREVEMLRRAADSHYVVDLLDLGELEDARRYLVMEWIEGENLEELLDSLRNMDQRLPLARACRICRNVARGLAEIHERGVVHLDLKPANVMVGPEAAGGDEIKLVDFGIAADFRGVRGGESLGSVVLGTSAYVAPEQLRGHPADPSFDVYALGVVCFETISGRSIPPRHLMSEALPRLDTLRHGAPAALADLVQSCMNVDPQRRPDSALRVALALEEVIDALEAEGARSVSTPHEGPVRTGYTEVALRSNRPIRDESVAVPVATGGTEVVLTHDEVASQACGRPELVGAAGAEPTDRDPSKNVEIDADIAVERSEPMRRPWLRAVVLGAAASLLAAGIGLSGDAGPAESTQEEGHGMLRERAESRQVPPVADEAALAMARPPSSPEDGATSIEPASTPGDRRRGAPSSTSCKSKRTAAERAKAKDQWHEVLRMTAAGGCWTSTELWLERRRLRVEAYVELGEYERCIGAGEGSHDAEVMRGVRYCRTKLGRG